VQKKIINITETILWIINYGQIYHLFKWDNVNKVINVKNLG